MKKVIDGVEVEVPDESDEAFGAFFAEAAGADPTEAKDEGKDEAALKADAEKAEADKAAADKAKADKIEADKVAEAEKGKAIDVDAILAQATAAAQKVVIDTEAEKEAARAAEAKKVEPSAEELEADKKFREEWPDHARRMDAQKAEMDELKNLIKQQSEMIQGQLNPLIANTQEEVDQRHRAAITEKHADAFDLVPEVDKWIAEQPDFQRDAFNKVMDTGTAAQVVQLYDIFKAATGRTVEKADPDAEKTRLAAEEKSKARHLTPVNSRRSVTVGAIDPQDFDGAFNQAAKEAMKQAV